MDEIVLSNVTISEVVNSHNAETDGLLIDLNLTVNSEEKNLTGKVDVRFNAEPDTNPLITILSTALHSQFLGKIGKTIEFNVELIRMNFNNNPEARFLRANYASENNNVVRNDLYFMRNFAFGVRVNLERINS